MVRAILTDIEGTTSSIHFVKEVLFPYAKKRLPDFLKQNQHKEEVKQQIAATRVLMDKPAASVDEVIAQLCQWIEEDKKITPLKTLQGFIWEAGYRNQDFYAHIYPDAVVELRKWHQAGLPIYIYSSGSIQAQKLFFEHSEASNILPLFNGHFDTTSGGKQEAASYSTIARAINLPPQEILFLSDVLAELNAAQQAGLQTRWVVRPQDCVASEAQLAHSGHIWVSSFAQIKF